MRVLIYILVAILAVGCAAETPGEHDNPPNPDKPNKIVIPIQPRPKYPGGIILEPRIIDTDLSFVVYRPTTSATYSVTVRSVATGEEYRAEIGKESDSITIPCLVVNDEYEITVISEDGTIVESVTLATVDAK